MNGDIAHACATRAETMTRFMPGRRYCWGCSTYQLLRKMTFGGRCWDCRHAPARCTAARVALDFLQASNPRAALLTLAIAVDEQANLEELDRGDAPTVTWSTNQRIRTQGTRDLRAAFARTGVGELYQRITTARLADRWRQLGYSEPEIKALERARTGGESVG